MDEDTDEAPTTARSVPPPAKRLGSLIRRARERRGLSQRNLAEEAGVSSETVRRIEAGLCDPRWSAAVQISRVLKLALDPDFFPCVAYGQIGAQRVKESK